MTAGRAPKQMNELPWMKFSPDRWQRDEAVRMCGAAARGVWLELICIMHKAEPYGHLLIRGKQPTDRQLSVITGLTLIELAEGLAELEENEVFNRTDDGTIFSRGMVRDEEIHVRSVKGGQQTQERKRLKEAGKIDPSRGSSSAGSSGPSSTPSNLESEKEGESLPVIPPKLGGPKTEIPDDWEPKPFTAGSAAHRIESGWTSDRRQCELDNFRSNHRRKRSLHVDWQDTWAGWVRNAEKFDNRAARDRAPAATTGKSFAQIVLEEADDRRRKQGGLALVAMGGGKGGP